MSGIAAGKAVEIQETAKHGAAVARFISDFPA
jgi:hypothetical protein